jgi:hypothetical protein
MSVEVVLLVVLSAHPALRGSHRNRAVLARLANRADKRGGGIRPAVGTIADRMDGGPTTDPAEREARDRRVRTALKELRESGVLLDTGEYHGEPGKAVPVRRIAVGELARYLDPEEAGPALLRMFATPDASITPDPHGHPLIPTITPGASLTPDPDDHPTPDHEDHPTPDPQDQVNLSYEPVHEPVLEHVGRGTSPESAEAPSASLVDDAQVQALNAAALAQRAALAHRAPAGLRRSRAKATPAPALPLEAPASAPVSVEQVEQAAPPSPADIQPPRRTPGEARLEAATVTLLAELTAGRPKVGAKVLAGWRAKLKARLSDGGVTAEAIEAAEVKIRKAWSALLASDWHAEKGLQSPGHLLERAERVEQLASRQQRQQPRNRWTQGGREMGQAATSAEIDASGRMVRADGSLAW